MKSSAYVMWPLLNGREWDLTVVVEGHQAQQGEDMQAYYNLLSPGYWQTMRIRLLRGRDLEERDRVDRGDDPQPWNVAIVNREFAEHFFGAQNPSAGSSAVVTGRAGNPYTHRRSGREFAVWRSTRGCAAADVSAVSGIGETRGCDFTTFFPRSPRPRFSRVCGALWRSLTARCRCTT